VYIATSNVQAPVTSPFTFVDKVKMISKLGIPASRVVQVSNPYQSKEITSNLSAEERDNTVLIFAVSQKDMAAKSPENPEGPRFNFGTKRNGEPSYLQPMPDNVRQMQPMAKHAYVEVTPTVNFRVKGADADSAKQIRKIYVDSNSSGRDQIITDLYGEVYPELRDVFDQRLGINEKMQGVIYGKPKIDAGTQAPAMQREHREKLVKLLKNTQLLEQRVRELHQPLSEDLIEDYLEETVYHKKK
jgi:hypothetical protein